MAADFVFCRPSTVQHLRLIKSLCLLHVISHSAWRACIEDVCVGVLVRDSRQSLFSAGDAQTSVCSVTALVSKRETVRQAATVENAEFSNILGRRNKRV